MAVVHVEGKPVTLPDEIVDLGTEAVRAALASDFPGVENADIKIDKKTSGAPAVITVSKRAAPKSSFPKAIFDEIAAAINGVRYCAEKLARQDLERRELLDKFEHHLRRLLDYPKVLEAPEVSKLLERVERLRELRNMEEYGSLELWVRRDMDAIWKRLP